MKNYLITLVVTPLVVLLSLGLICLLILAICVAGVYGILTIPSQLLRELEQREADKSKLTS